MQLFSGADAGEARTTLEVDRLADTDELGAPRPPCRSAVPDLPCQ